MGWYMKAAIQGNADSQFNVGMKKRKEKNDSKKKTKKKDT